MLEIEQHHPFKIGPLNGSAPQVLEQAHLLDIEYWLGGGTVLGLYRDDDFIPNDTDIDIEVEGYNGVDKKLLDTFSDMILVRTVYLGKRPMQMAFVHKGVIFDVYILWREGDLMVNWNDMGTMQTPGHFYDDLEILITKYGEYPIPSPIEDYLVVRYGSDWMTPKNHKGLYTNAI